MKAVVITVGIVAMFMFTGCGTLATRTGHGGREDFYPATKADSYII
jgi:uncharacterized protein YceK